MKKIIPKKSREVRRARVRATVTGTGIRPRLNVFRSLKGMYVQIIDDVKAVTLVAADVKEIKKVEKSDKYKNNKEAQAYNLGKLLAEKAVAKKIESVVFDRAGYRYHGRVKALAEGAREGGLKF
ncbi:MAG: 50S ribosomal protein L18 [Candidatus Magasanikbacteria bacterium GW2011_GWC2_37_14]|uniref:Large ribosomal subunit protein uL18 n=1 Tax=Candidatus Magasanikbacteria bacterium GW2011_GWC2_37_14 TaxID=1619046 RepID=A0A0G0GLW1_9BACT|nr:MAG: 50S ribosomal protein L18 [Candidatus Magasanikbacteria bacterium GW2011_GWC2_37_14]